MYKKKMEENEIKPPPYFRWQQLPQQWSCCIKKKVFYLKCFKQTPCNNQKCPSIYCHRVRSIKQYKHLYLNYYINPPTYAIGFSFNPNSDILNQKEALYLRSILVKELKKSLNLGWDLFNEWDKNHQIHWHGTSFLQKDHPYASDKKMFEEFLKNAFHTAINKTSSKYYKNIIANNVYCQPILSIKGLSKYYAKAEEYVIKHNPRPSSWVKRMRNSLSSTGYYKVKACDVDKYLNDWKELYKNQELNKTNSSLININNNDLILKSNKSNIFNLKNFIFTMSWGFSLIASLMFFINELKFDQSSKGLDKFLDLKYEHNLRSRIMILWLLQDFPDYYQIE